MISLDELEAVCRLSTQGQRRTGHLGRRCKLDHEHGRGKCVYEPDGWTDDPEYFGRWVSLRDGTVLVGGDDSGPHLTRDDARQIAACDPETVMALVKAVRCARSVIDNYDWELSDWPEVKELRESLEAVTLSTPGTLW